VLALCTKTVPILVHTRASSVWGTGQRRAALAEACGGWDFDVQATL